MKHHSNIKKLGRKTGVRQALYRSLANNMIKNEKIVTTEAKAKALRPYVEKIITHAKKDTVQARRLLVSKFGSGIDVEKLFQNIGPRFKDRNGGYTRIIKLPPRQGDNSSMALIELV